MRVEQTADHLVLRERPPVFVWALAVLAIAIGLGLVARSPLNPWLAGDPPPPIEATYSLLSGLAAIAVGLFSLIFNSGSVCTFDRRDGSLRVERRGPFGHTVRRYPLADIAGVVLAEDRDSDGDPVYRPEAILRAGGMVPLSRLWSNDAVDCRHVARAADTFLRPDEGRMV